MVRPDGRKDRAMALRCTLGTQWDGRSDVEREGRTLGRGDDERALCCGLLIKCKCPVPCGGGGMGVIACGCGVGGQWMFDVA